MKLNGTYQNFYYADDVIMLDGSVHTIKKIAETLLFDSTSFGIEVNGNITKYMVMSGDWNERRNHDMKVEKPPLKGWKN
jgi:hypothetical protein